MAIATVGQALRAWRERRRLTQLELALDTGVSARHVSFVETGRSQPGRDTMLRLLARLDVPFRERNRLLITAGHAPAFPERGLGDPELAPVRDALDRALASHEPYPAVVVDHAWTFVAANASMAALTEHMDVDPSLLEPPVNVMRVGFHPRGLAPYFVNLGRWHALFRDRLERQLAMTGDERIAALLDEIDGYPHPPYEPPDGDLLGPLKIRGADGGELAFFGMFATFDNPFEVTASELAIEFLFPADRATAAALEREDP